MMRWLVLAIAPLMVLAIGAADAGAVQPLARTGPALAVTSTSGTLTGSVVPSAESTSWYFEYRTTARYGSQTPRIDAGQGTQEVNATAILSRLVAATTYHFRLVARNRDGISAGADQSFTTDGRPVAVTRAASGVGTTGATLNGTVTTNAGSTTWYFEYGTTTGYGLRTLGGTLGPSTRALAVSEAVTGLAAGTTYHVRLVVRNAAGASAGTDQTLVTTPLPLARTGPAQQVTAQSATLTGSIDSKGRSGTAFFDYGETSAYGLRTAAQAISARPGDQNVVASVTGLRPNTVYHYRLVVTTSAGTGTGTDIAVTTLVPVTLRTAAFRVLYGGYVTLSGAVTGGQPGVSVSVLGQPLGGGSFVPVATVLSGAGGSWTYLARPTIQTAYQAAANGGTSAAAVTVGVRPAVSLNLISRARYLTRVRAGGPFAGKFVQFQRLAGGRWLTIKRARLNANSAAIFPARLLPSGRSTIRVAFSVNQGGPGYLGGFSRTRSYHRR
jgi:hypothetical protein